MNDTGESRRGEPRRLLPPLLAAPPDRILSAQQCEELADRVSSMAVNGGETATTFDSRYSANLRWANNAITTGGEIQQTLVSVARNVLGAGAFAQTNVLTDDALRTAVRRAEAMTILKEQDPDQYPVKFDGLKPWKVNPISQPKIWDDATYAMDASARAKVAAPLMAMAEERGLNSAGYIQIDAQGASVQARSQNLARYYPRTMAQFSVTVRDPKRSASGWAGLDHNSWDKINPEALMRTAIDKCERSRDPVAIEPGFYTAILEPQAVADLMDGLFRGGGAFSRMSAEAFLMGPFVNRKTRTVMLTERITDDRLTITADPMDPECGFIPFDWNGEPYIPTEWSKDGVLTQMSHDRWYALLHLNRDYAQPDSLAFRMQWNGRTTSVDEMVASTERGILVTRFNNVDVMDWDSSLVTGNTRDGIWLVERGKISKPLRNFRFLQSVLAMLNSIEQVGVPQRVFRPSAPAICPPMRVRDFFFNGLMDAV